MPGPIKSSEIKILAPLPQSVVRLAQIVSDPDSSVYEFCQVIELDAPLTANVLKWANSAWSQAQASIDTIENAVIRLGSENVLKLSIGYHLMGPMSKANPAYNLSEDELWRHSVLTALGVETIRPLVEVKIPAAAYAAALMHDIGKIILGRRLGHDSLLDMIESLMAEHHYSYIDAEREAVGTDHAEVGAAVAEAWNLPEDIIETIRFHHDVNHTNNPILHTVHVANVIAHYANSDEQIDDAIAEFNITSLQHLGLTSKQLHSICVQVQQELEHTEKRWAHPSTK